MRPLTLALILLATASACGTETSPVDAAADAGIDASFDASDPAQVRALYEQPFPDGNAFACATCHALAEPASDGLRRPGHPLSGAANRPTYKNGQLTDLRDAVNSCLDEWMKADPLTENEPRWTALEGFLEEQGAASGAVTFTISEPPSALTGGTPSAGRATFNETCAVCHGTDAAGAPQGPGLVGGGLSVEQIARRIRTSGSAQSGVYAGLTGGVMPFWSQERLSDAELLDVVAYVKQRSDESVVVRDAGMNDTGPGDCPSTHPSVGRTGELSTVAHQVSGTVTVVNDCTLRVDNFVFDGGGIDVRWYAGTDRSYDPPTGFAISDDIFGTAYNNETVFLTVPEGKTLDDFDSVSVWCVDVGANFGDTKLE